MNDNTHYFDRARRAWFPRRVTMPTTTLGRVFAAFLALFVSVPLLMAAVTTIDIVAQTHGTLTETRGGTGQTSYTLGDLLYASASNTLGKLAGNITTTNKFLCQTGTGSVSAAPSWCTLVAGDIPGLDASKITTGTIGTARLGTGTPTASTYLRGDQTWATVPAALSTVANETPTGTVDGTNTSFTTAHACTYLYLFKNGQRMTPGASADYQYSGSTITFASGSKPLTGDVLLDDCEY